MDFVRRIIDVFADVKHFSPLCCCRLTQSPFITLLLQSICVYRQKHTLVQRLHFSTCRYLSQRTQKHIRTFQNTKNTYYNNETRLQLEFTIICSDILKKWSLKMLLTTILKCPKMIDSEKNQTNDDTPKTTFWKQPFLIVHTTVH